LHSVVNQREIWCNSP